MLQIVKSGKVKRRLDDFGGGSVVIADALLIQIDNCRHRFKKGEGLLVDGAHFFESWVLMQVEQA